MPAPQTTIVPPAEAGAAAVAPTVAVSTAEPVAAAPPTTPYPGPSAPTYSPPVARPARSAQRAKRKGTKYTPEQEMALLFIEAVGGAKGQTAAKWVDRQLYGEQNASDTGEDGKRIPGPKYAERLAQYVTGRTTLRNPLAAQAMAALAAGRTPAWVQQHLSATTAEGLKKHIAEFDDDWFELAQKTLDQFN